MSDFAKDEAESAPDREHTGGGNFGGAGEITGITAEEEFVINNGNGASAHTFTFYPRGSAGDTATFTDYLAQGQSCKYSGRGISKVTIDSADSATLWKKGPRGTVSVPNSVSGGSGAATAVFSELSANYASNAQAMLGLGATVQFTPKKTGIVLLIWTGTLEATDTGAPLIEFNNVVRGYHGTPASGAPANGAAPSGGADLSLNYELLVEENAATIEGQYVPFTAVFVLSLTPGDSYWFDLSVIGIDANAKTTFAGAAYVIELSQ